MISRYSLKRWLVLGMLATAGQGFTTPTARLSCSPSTSGRSLSETEDAQPQNRTEQLVLIAASGEEEESMPQERIQRDAGGWGKAVSRDERPQIADDSLQQEAQKQQRRNIGVAVASVMFALLHYVWQFAHPITPIQLLAEMQQTSAPITSIGTNGKPTVVDFWAPWCENCKMAAPTLHEVEEEYRDRVNFVMVNGDADKAWPLIERFGVDAIPHLALVNAEGDVETALIGPIPKSVLQADLDVLLKNADEGKEPLPYAMLDVFANRPERRRVRFDNEI